MDQHRKFFMNLAASEPTAKLTMPGTMLLEDCDCSNNQQHKKKEADQDVIKHVEEQFNLAHLPALSPLA